MIVCLSFMRACVCVLLLQLKGQMKTLQSMLQTTLLKRSEELSAELGAADLEVAAENLRSRKAELATAETVMGSAQKRLDGEFA